MIHEQKRLSRWLFLLLIGMFPLFYSCVTVTGEALLPPIEKDVELGLEVAKQIENEMGLYDTPEVNAYLNQIGQRLVRINPDQRFNYTFLIADQHVPNAFAAPGGWVYCTRGLLLLTNTEDEVAAILGHEISHISQRHTAKLMSKAQLPGLFTLPGKIVGAVVSEDLGDLINAPVYVLGSGYIAQHSQRDEFEADHGGLNLSVLAGYDPAALATILVRIERYAEFQTGEKRIPGFFDTHPSTANRANQIAEYTGQLSKSPQQSVNLGIRDHLRRLDGMLIGENPAAGVFIGRKFMHPELYFAITMPKGWEGTNTRQAVAVLSPDEDAALFLSIVGKGGNPQKSAQEFIASLQKEFNIQPSEASAIKIGKLPAYSVLYSDQRGEKSMHLQALWLAYQNVIYRFVGLGPSRYQKTLGNSAVSFRPLYRKERDAIKEVRLKIVTARSNDTLAQISKRHKNAWDTQTTAVVNGLEANQRLKKGRPIKIAIRQPYRGKENGPSP